MYIPECTLMEKEVVLLMECKGNVRIKGNSCVGFIPFYCDFIDYYAVEYHDTLRSLTKMYQNSLYIYDGRHRIPRDCNIIDNAGNIIDKNVNIYSSLMKSDTSGTNYVVVQDERFKNKYDKVNEEGNLFMQGKSDDQFCGHIYKAFKVKLQCLYAGKHFQLIRNFGLRDSDQGFQRKALCNVYAVTRIDSIEPIDIDASKIMP